MGLKIRTLTEFSQQSSGHVNSDSKWVPWRQCLRLTDGRYLFSLGLDLFKNIAVAHDGFDKLQHPQACFAHSLHFFNGGVKSLQET